MVHEECLRHSLKSSSSLPVATLHPTGMSVPAAVASTALVPSASTAQASATGEGSRSLPPFHPYFLWQPQLPNLQVRFVGVSLACIAKHTGSVHCRDVLMLAG